MCVYVCAAPYTELILYEIAHTLISIIIVKRSKKKKKKKQKITIKCTVVNEVSALSLSDLCNAIVCANVCVSKFLFI